MNADTLAPQLIYRDALMLVLNKPGGLPVSRDARKGGPSLTDWLDGYRFGLPRIPELAHRLDRDTSGCLVLGRHRKALARLGKLFQRREIGKTYWALVPGAPDGDGGTIDLPLGRLSTHPADWRQRVDPAGQPAQTRWRVLTRSEAVTWLELEPLTGRTHQLRVHCAAIGCPIVGDRTYGTPDGAGPMMLHARVVSIPLYPSRPPIVVTAAPPDAMARILFSLGWSDRGDENPRVMPGDADVPDGPLRQG